MGKQKKNKKRGRTQKLYEAARKAHKRIQENDELSHPHTDSDLSCSVTASQNDDVSEDDLNQVVRTLALLTESPQQLELVRYSKRFKELRRVLHPLVVQQVKAYDKGTDYRAKVSVHLLKHEYNPAIAALKACLDLDQIPKQGTVQRWVREADSCAEGQPKIELLSLILTLGGAQQESDEIGTDGVDAVDAWNKHDPRVALIEAQKNVPDNNSTSLVTILDSWNIPGCKTTKDGTPAFSEDNLSFTSKVIYQEKAEERIPPNYHDLLLHYATPAHPEDSVIPFEPIAEHPVTCQSVPFVKGGIVLKNVLSRSECQYLKTAATKLGYRPDHPTALESSTGIDSCEWFIHDCKSQLQVWTGTAARNV